MNKPPIEDFEAFSKQFQCEAAAAGKQEFLAPYFIAGHPGCDLAAMIELALYLKRHSIRPDKVQDFIPSPMDVATCMFYTGLDPMSGKSVYVARGARERRLQRALLQFFKPENYADVREALEQAGRADLIGGGADCLIPSRPPKRCGAGVPPARAADHRPAPQQSAGYRPHRNTARRRKGRKEL